MIDRTLDQLEKSNTLLLRIKPKKAAEMIEKLISDGEELFSRYEVYDKTILSFELCDVGPNGFSDNGYDITQSVNPVLFHFNIPDEKCVEVRTYGLPKRYSLPEYNYIRVNIEGLSEDEIASKILKEVIPGLSIKSTVRFSVFNLNEYKIWESNCEHMLTTIGYNVTWFKQAKGGLNIYVTNPDKHFIDSFLRQINSLYTTLEMISESSIIHMGLIKKWIKFKKWVKENPKKVAVWFFGIVLSTVIGFYLQPFLPDIDTIKKLIS